MAATALATTKIRWVGKIQEITRISQWPCSRERFNDGNVNIKYEKTLDKYPAIAVTPTQASRWDGYRLHMIVIVAARSQ